ncbi:MAG: ABC transporter permease [Chloroflexi bacterium]|nr:MAG: ABC transporter permease [Chloroflexota bacterium]
MRWDWLGHHTDVIWQALVQHIQLTGIAVLGGLAIATPVGLLVWRWRALRNPVLSVAGILYTIPSLALFALLVPFTGLTVVTAEIGLVSYTILILVRNIVVGLDGVPAEIREAATGMGYRPAKRLLTIDIPLALPVIVAGVRLATVTTIGLVTVTALLGEGGLGQLILAGLIQDFKTPLVVGLAGSVVLAVAADLLLAGAQRLATPWRSSR